MKRVPILSLACLPVLQAQEQGALQERFDEVTQTLMTAARSGRIGDGKLFVYAVEEAIRIRNDNRGEAAL